MTRRTINDLKEINACLNWQTDGYHTTELNRARELVARLLRRVKRRKK